ncbi:MAG: phosphoribosyl-ATP diphosphatase [Candidatus Aminicenantia bacterium]
MIIPSIDLMKGKVVQLKQGKEKILEIHENPLSIAEKLGRFGPIALIDLDGALQRGSNEGIIKEICKITDCRVGGGIREIEKAVRILELGAEKIIIGTASWDGKRLNRAFLRELTKTVGRENVIIALDSYNEEVLINGWRMRTGLSVFEVINDFKEYASEVLVTCIEREGTLKGTSLEFFKKLKASTDLPLVAAGGISTIEEIAYLSKIEIDVQLGMSIYTGRLSLADAFIASLNWEKGISGILPVIVVNESGQIMMLAWVSQESLRRTFETGRACFFSRSRKAIWTKGESSGNFQEFLKIRGDCDGDALIFFVRQRGEGACHKGRYSCFSIGKNFSLETLYDIVTERIKNKNPQSYTSFLDDKKVKEKLLEEAKELTEAEGKEGIIWETADLFYFTTVLLSRAGIDLKEVIWELKRRNLRKKAEKRRRGED